MLPDVGVRWCVDVTLIYLNRGPRWRWVCCAFDVPSSEPSYCACCSITCPSLIDGIKSIALASVIDHTLYLLLPWLTIYFSSRPRPGRFSAVFTDWNFPKILFYCLRLWSIFSFFSVSLFGYYTKGIIGSGFKEKLLEDRLFFRVPANQLLNWIGESLILWLKHFYAIKTFLFQNENC